MSFCFICSDPLISREFVRVQKKGVKTLIAASVARGEKAHQTLLENADFIEIHEACRKKYGNLRRASLSSRGATHRSSSRSNVQMLEEKTFEFTTSCFICCESAENSTRGPVHLVKNKNTKYSFLSILRSFTSTIEISSIIERLESVRDISKVGARYHAKCKSELYFNCNKTTGKPKISMNIDKSMIPIYDYLLENEEQCQFTLTELYSKAGKDRPSSLSTFRARLQERFGDDIIFVENAGKSTVVMFRNTCYKVLSDHFYEFKSENSEDEKIRVIDEAAAITLEEIRSSPFNIDEYPAPDSFLDNVENDIPRTLRRYLSQIILKLKKGSTEQWEKKCLAIAHAIIAAARPRKYVSPLQIGVGAFVYKKTGSKDVIEVLNSLGFSSSYKEVRKFEALCVTRPPPRIRPNSFAQFVFDNADWNTNTLDGKGTFHVMGGIRCLTPHNSLVPDTTIERSSTRPSSAYLGHFGTSPLLHYEMSDSRSNVTHAISLKEYFLNHDKIEVKLIDSLWIYAKWICKPEIPGWNGFMEKVRKDDEFSRSKILPLPFIDAPASDYNTIYTALMFALEKCQETQQKIAIVTFDQPLYWKAQQIVSGAESENPLKNVVVRLGGFHLLMSFMGAIGNIMSGSGLEELFKVIYAENSVDKIMSGHAYSRAVRAHFLTHLSLAKIILDSTELSDDLRDDYDHLLDNYMNWSTVSEEEQLKLTTLARKFMETIESFKNRGSTAKLWILYFKMTTLIKDFLEAERSGSWELHLGTIYKMLPFFHASGHLQYAKSAHLYLQNMTNLQNIMPAEEFRKFTEHGFFTIRRSDKFWSGIFSDQTIEQELMRRIKVFGGLVYRGLSDSSKALFISGSIAMSAVSQEMEEFCGNHLVTSEQHVDARSARTTRDNIDVQKLDMWLAKHPPFPECMELFSISSGVVADNSINCHEADEVGGKLLEKTVGQVFENMKLHRKDRVNTFATMSRSVTIASEKVTISTQTIFHRMILTQRTDEELAECLKYELAPYPLSLFDDGGMRKTQKSALFREFEILHSTISVGDNVCEVIDGGFLLHRVTWQQDKLFSEICSSYASYISRNYGKNVIIVFDGYPEDARTSSTKIAERQRRAKGGRAADILCDETTKFSKTTQKQFLANERNKKTFIGMLTTHLTVRGFKVKQAWEDADMDIVKTAIEEAPRFESVIIVGEDTDLLVLMCALGKNIKNLYFRKVGKGAVAMKMYSTDSFKHKVLREHLLFMHAFSGCDTVSAICGMGKKKIIEVIKKNVYLQKGLELFKKSNPGQIDIAAAGERVLIALYGGKESDSSIDQLRYKIFSRAGLKMKTELSRLPPTSSAARQHSLRTYHQVQKWIGIEKNALEWGWKERNGILEPVTTDQEPIPPILLDIVSCGCKTNCKRACGCRKAGLNCSVLCKVCCGETCTNAKRDVDDWNDVDDEIDNEHPTMVPLPRTTASLKRKASQSPVISENEDEEED